MLNQLSGLNRPGQGAEMHVALGRIQNIKDVKSFCSQYLYLAIHCTNLPYNLPKTTPTHTFSWPLTRP